MATDSDQLCKSAAEERRLENEAFLKAIQNCDETTYREIISILGARGLLRELIHLPDQRPA